MSKTRQFVRQRGGVQAPGFDAAKAFREALTSDGAAKVFDDVHGVGPRLMFTLKVRDIAVVILTPDGRHLGTFADPLRAVVNAFHLLDRAAEHQRSARPRPTRVRRRTTEKETTR